MRIATSLRSCCGTQNSLFADRSQNFDHCRAFPLASSAAGGAHKRPLAMTMLKLCHSEEARRAVVPEAWPPPTKFHSEIWGVGQGRRPLRVVAEGFHNCQGSALSAERVTGQIRSLPDKWVEQHGAQGAVVCGRPRPCSGRGCRVSELDRFEPRPVGGEDAPHPGPPRPAFFSFDGSTAVFFLGRQKENGGGKPAKLSWHPRLVVRSPAGASQGVSSSTGTPPSAP